MGISFFITVYVLYNNYLNYDQNYSGNIFEKNAFHGKDANYLKFFTLTDDKNILILSMAMVSGKLKLG